MDQDTTRLVAELCTRIGMIMEDVVDSALTIEHATPAERRQRLLDLQRSARTVTQLIDAAVALNA